MNVIRPIAQTDDTVTLRRTDFEMMLEAVEDAEDIMALRHTEAHPVRIWREHRGLSPQALADKAAMARSYLVEIESHKKPGSVAVYRRLANALGVAVDDLLPPEEDEGAEH
jgi:ribosome-binding protein aMBF1 (putative translation factor)